ncbi:hypothetical protein RQP46_006029 [Phenoliferia psychrophenolica]
MANATWLALGFGEAMDDADMVPMIYAYGSENPGKSDADATLAVHDMLSIGSTYVDLSATFTASEATISAPVRGDRYLRQRQLDQGYQ